MDLVTVLSGDAPLQWMVARVQKIDAGQKSLQLVVGDNDPDDPKVENEDDYPDAREGFAQLHIMGARYLDTYTPQVGDIVQVLVKRNIGSLVLGKIAK